MQNKLVLLIFGLIMVILTTGIIGGCGGSTTTTYFYYYPDWTPDGKILCSKNRQVTTQGSGSFGGGGGTVSNNYYLTIMDADGSNERDIKSIGNGAKVAASPLGNYYSYVEVYTNIIHVVTTAGAFVSDIDAGADLYSLDWNPSETKIVYGTLSGESFIVLKDGTGKTSLYNGGSSIAWRYGERIVHKGSIGSDWGGLIVDGDSLSVLYTNTKTKGGEFNISKVNTNEVYYRGDKIFKALINTSEATPDLVIDNSDLWNIKLSPDGQKIIASGPNTSGSEIWLVNIDGTGLKQLR